MSILAIKSWNLEVGDFIGCVEADDILEGRMKDGSQRGFDEHAGADVASTDSASDMPSCLYGRKIASSEGAALLNATLIGFFIVGCACMVV